MGDIRNRWNHAQTIEPELHINGSYEDGRCNYEKSYEQYFKYAGGSFDLRGKSICEIGPAHFPALSFCTNYSRSYVVDPMNSEYLQMSIDGKNIVHIKHPAEDIELPFVDEIWLFNILTHVMDPAKIIDKCKRASRVIRFFEPINQGTDECHLHDFSLAFFREHFGECVNHYQTNPKAQNFHQHEAAYGVFENDFPLIQESETKTGIQLHPVQDREDFVFKKIHKVCISLSSSRDRRYFVREEFKRVGANVSFLPAVDKTKVSIPTLCKKPAGVYACMQSHLNAVKWAKVAGVKAICIFEDDVIFCDDFNERIAYIESLADFDFDVLALGGHFASKNHAGRPTKWKHIHRVTDIGGTYAYILKSSTFDFIIDNVTYHYGADEFYSNHLYHRFASFAFVPFLCGCRPCRSTITDQIWEYENINWTYQQSPIQL